MRRAPARYALAASLLGWVSLLPAVETPAPPAGAVPLAAGEAERLVSGNTWMHPADQGGVYFANEVELHSSLRGKRSRGTWYSERERLCLDIVDWGGEWCYRFYRVGAGVQTYIDSLGRYAVVTVRPGDALGLAPLAAVPAAAAARAAGFANDSGSAQTPPPPAGALRISVSEMGALLMGNSWLFEKGDGGVYFLDDTEIYADWKGKKSTGAWYLERDEICLDVTDWGGEWCYAFYRVGGMIKTYGSSRGRYVVVNVQPGDALGLAPARAAGTPPTAAAPAPAAGPQLEAPAPRTAAPSREGGRVATLAPAPRAAPGVGLDVAILPFWGTSKWTIYEDREDERLSTWIASVVREIPSAHLAYSYYESGPASGVDVSNVWKSAGIRRVPDPAAAAEAGRRLGAEAVIMQHYELPGAYGAPAISDRGMRLQTYVIDVASGEVHHLDERVDSERMDGTLRGMVRNALAGPLRARGLQ